MAALVVLWGCGVSPQAHGWSSLICERLASDICVAEVVHVVLERPWVYVDCAREFADAFLRARDPALKIAIGRVLERVLAYCGEGQLDEASRVCIGSDLGQDFVELTGVFIRSRARAAVLRHVGWNQGLLLDALGGNVPGLMDEEGYPRGLVREVALEVVIANGLFAIPSIYDAVVAMPNLDQSLDNYGGQWRRENEYAIMSGNRMARMIELRVSAKE